MSPQTLTFPGAIRAGHDTMNDCLTLPLSATDTPAPDPVVPKPTALSNRMNIIVFGTLFSGGLGAYIIAFSNGWTSQDWVVIIGALSTFAAAIFGGWMAVNNNRTKNKIEE